MYLHQNFITQALPLSCMCETDWEQVDLKVTKVLRSLLCEENQKFVGEKSYSLQGALVSQYPI